MHQLDKNCYQKPPLILIIDARFWVVKLFIDKKKKSHLIVKLIHSSFYSESKILS